MVEVAARQHDELTAVTQALTHAAVLAFGLALEELDVDVRALGELAPPPHLTLLAMLARIAAGQPETYRDVQAANPCAPRTRAALAEGVRRLADLIETGDAADFGTLLEQLRDRLGPELDHYRELCADLFEMTRPPAGGLDALTVATSANTRRKGPAA